ncbi:MAG: hypothetical protein EXS35_05150 [Pedosphaera sp.]|nr:hypothetical protein [Pedosphaera sp.]
MLTAVKPAFSVGEFLRAEARRLREWMAQRDAGLVGFCVAAVVVGAGLYGAAMGSWREPLQSLYTGIKLPLAILLTTLGNGLLNGMLAPLLGLNVTLRQSLGLVLFGFAVTAVILGALSPVALFLVWNTPPLNAATQLTSPEYGFLQLALAVFIAVAGVTGCARLWPLLREWAGNAQIGGRVLFAWLATNLFLGSQVCWVLRPFLWDPAGPPRFIGREYLHGSFFETVFEAARRLIF